MSAAPPYSPRAYEYVYLISDELEEVVPATTDAGLEQSTADVLSRFTIFNGSYLGVRRQGTPREPGDYWINLAFLDPRPTRCADRFWSLAAAIFAVATACALSAIYSRVMSGSGPALTLTAIALSVATLASGTLAIRRYCSKLIFLTRHGRVPVLWLSMNRPDRNQFRGFIRAMHAAIARATADRADLPRGHLLRDEMKEHRRLQNAGVLDERQFQIARRLILEAHE